MTASTTTEQYSLFAPIYWYQGELNVWRRRERLSPSQWAEKYREVTMGAHQGRWSNSITPYLTRIMDTYGLPHVRELVVCAVAQSGKTNAMYNCFAWSVDQSPGPCMFVMPSKSSVDKSAADRIIPMIEQSGRLRKLKSDNPDDTAKTRIKLKNGTIVYTAWANSATALASFPIKYLYFDEVDKYPPTVSKETDPITLGEKRNRMFSRTCKRFKVSTPTRESGFIWQALQKCHQIWAYDVVCPECGAAHQMRLEQLRVPEDKKPEELEMEKSARYECPACGVQWDNRAREKAIRAGDWKTVTGGKLKRPEKIGFHIPAWICLDISLTEIAVAHRRAQGNPVKMIDFYNDYLAEPYEEFAAERDEDRILALRDERPRGLVPSAEISCLTIAIDTQQNGYYYEVRAWGFGAELESWQVREGFVESDAALERILYNTEYCNMDGKSYEIIAGLIDSGGTRDKKAKHSRTWEVYEFCRHNPIIKPIKGQQRQSSPWKVSTLDTYPGSNKAIPGGLKLYNLHATYYKDQLAGKLEIAPTDPGAWHLHAETTEDYARQMCAEYRDERGLWQCPRSKANHFWDVSYYQLAQADILNIKYWRRPEKIKPSAEAKEKTEINKHRTTMKNRSRPSWFSSRR